MVSNEKIKTARLVYKKKIKEILKSADDRKIDNLRKKIKEI